MNQDIRFCTTPDGVRLAYAVSGTGPPLVMSATWLTHLEHQWRSLAWRPWLDAFTREDLWETMQLLWLDRKFTVLLVTHDLTEAAFLADTVHVVSSRPGRIVHSRAIDLPRPRPLDLRFRQDFVDIVHDLRAHIGRAREEGK